MSCFLLFLAHKLLIRKETVVTKDLYKRHLFYDMVYSTQYEVLGVTDLITIIEAVVIMVNIMRITYRTTGTHSGGLREIAVNYISIC